MLKEFSEKLIQPKAESVQPEKQADSQQNTSSVQEEPKPVPAQKSAVPLNTQKLASRFSIHDALTKNEEKESDIHTEVNTKDLPSKHFSEMDLQTEWNLFLEQIRKKDIVLYSAINGFRLSKKDENTVVINYPSESAKSEFEKIQGEFFNHFKRKVNHFQLVTEFRMDVALKKEIVTKRTLFEKMAEINPLLKDLDDLMKFDFT
ncbi:MAG: hypothetical protein QM564_13970 [Bergeyella sp.]